MWKYIYISLIIIAIIAGISGIWINQDNSSPVAPLAQRLGIVSKRKQAEVLMGMRKAQETRLAAMQEDIDAQMQRFKDQQLMLRQQMIDMKNQVDLSTAQFTEILAQDVAMARQRSTQDAGFGGLVTAQNLSSLQEMLNAVRTQAAGSSIPPRDQISLRIKEIRQRVESLTSSIDPHRATQYRQQMDQLQDMVDQREQLTRQYDDMEQRQREMSVQNRQMLQDAMQRMKDLNDHNSIQMEDMRLRMIDNKDRTEALMAEQRISQAQQRQNLEDYQRMFDLQHQAISNQRNNFNDHQERIREQKQIHEDRLEFLRGR